MSKKARIFLITGIALFLGLAITFFFLDLNISKSFVTSNPSFIVLLYAAVGEFPIYIGPIMFGLVYGFTLENKWAKLAAHLLGLVAVYVAMMRLTKGIFKYFLNGKLVLFQYILLAIAALLIYLLGFLLVSKVKKETLYKLRDIALIYLLVSAISFISIEVLKRLWGRERYRALDENYSEYTNFLTINGFKRGFISDEYRSFPSGHTSSAASLFVLTLIPMRFSKKKIWQYVVAGISFLYVLVMAFCRVKIGAHYASDTLFGLGISVTCFILIYMLFKKKGWLHVRSN